MFQNPPILAIFDSPKPKQVRNSRVIELKSMIKGRTISNCCSSILLLLSFSFFSTKVFGQGLTANVSQLNFGTTNELSSSMRSVILTNNMSRSVEVTDVRFYNTYGAAAFSVSSSSFTIAPGASATLDVWFSPRHNISHNSEMVIFNDGLRGSVRVDLIGQGTYSKAYYSNTQDLAEENLKSSLHTIITNGYVSLIYGPARDEMFMVIDNQAVNGQGASQNTLESIYTGQLAVGYTSRTDAQNTFLFNTEHTFPQSLFTSLEPMKSDLHHLFPTDDVSNSNRADNPFGVVTNPSWTGGGSKSNGTIFEPRDIQKGRSARAMFYFVLRYENYSNFLNSQESILRNWHSTYSPDAIDIKRNNDIFSFQNNRNPFIDYPQFIDRITSLSTLSIAPQLSSLDITQDTLVYGTVPSNSNTDFRLVLVNKGNTAITFSQFSLSHPGKLSFQSSGNDTTLNPGEALTLDIRYFSTTTDSLRGWLSFQTNVNGMSQVNIPIFVNDLIFTGISTVGTKLFSLYPNPSGDIVHLNFGNEVQGNADIKLFSMSGILLKQYLVQDHSRDFEIELGDIAAGVYFVQYINRLSGAQNTHRFIKLN